MRQNDDGKTVAAMDMLVPRVMIFFSYFMYACYIYSKYYGLQIRNTNLNVQISSNQAFNV